MRSEGSTIYVDSTFFGCRVGGKRRVDISRSISEGMIELWCLSGGLVGCVGGAVFGK